MARYEHLPIYKVAMDLTVYIEQVVRNFSRYQLMEAVCEWSNIQQAVRRVKRNHGSAGVDDMTVHQ